MMIKVTHSYWVDGETAAQKLADELFEVAREHTDFLDQEWETFASEADFEFPIVAVTLSALDDLGYDTKQITLEEFSYFAKKVSQQVGGSDSVEEVLTESIHGWAEYCKFPLKDSK